MNAGYVAPDHPVRDLYAAFKEVPHDVLIRWGLLIQASGGCHLHELHVDKVYWPGTTGRYATLGCTASPTSTRPPSWIRPSCCCARTTCSSRSSSRSAEARSGTGPGDDAQEVGPMSHLTDPNSELPPENVDSVADALDESLPAEEDIDPAQVKEQLDTDPEEAENFPDGFAPEDDEFED